MPLGAAVLPANANDATALEPALNKALAQAPEGRRPKRLLADRGYDSERLRRWLRDTLGIEPEIARRRTPHGSGLGRERWPIERDFAWLGNFHRLKPRRDRLAQTFEALLTLALSLITWRILKT